MTDNENLSPRDALIWRVLWYHKHHTPITDVLDLNATIRQAAYYARDMGRDDVFAYWDRWFSEDPESSDAYEKLKEDIQMAIEAEEDIEDKSSPLDYGTEG